MRVQPPDSYENGDFVIEASSEEALTIQRALIQYNRDNASPGNALEMGNQIADAIIESTEAEEDRG